jgi:SAM-dependent methyltransferase
MLLEKIKELSPKKALDIGCGCGSFTASFAPYCGEVTAIDHSPGLIERCMREHALPNVTYRCVDARRLKLPDKGFDLVCERASLHHIKEWKQALDEMARVSSRHVLLEEPVDDPRSLAKRNTIAAHQFFLEVQEEAGYPHFAHLQPVELEQRLHAMGLDFTIEFARSDNPVDIEEYFEPFERFAGVTARKEYWMTRLFQFKRSVAGAGLVESDTLFVVADKR